MTTSTTSRIFATTLAVEQINGREFTLKSYDTDAGTYFMASYQKINPKTGKGWCGTHHVRGGDVQLKFGCSIQEVFSSEALLREAINGKK